MNALFNFISPEFVEAFGWTIIHSLWQGILVAGAIIVIFSLMHRNSAQVKYLIGYSGLLLMLGWSAITFVKSPLTIGAFKPVILFPVAAFTGLSVRDVEAILAHELAHIARRDYLFNIIQSVIGLIYFYHPGVWLVSSLINAERENSCDNIAIGLTGDKKGYIRTLAQVEINRAENQNLAMAFASRKGSVLSRIKHIQKQKAMKTNFIEGLIAAAVVVAGFMLVSFTVGNSVHTQMLPNEGPVLEVPEGESEPVAKEWTEQEIDSLKTSVEKQLAEKEDVEDVSEEVERMVEVAMSESDPGLQAEIMAEVNRALAEIDIDAIVNGALSGVGATLDALSEIDFDSIETTDTLTQEQIDELEKLLEAKEQKLKEEKKKLKKKEKELKKK